MKKVYDQQINDILELEHQYGPYSKSEKFHYDTKIHKKEKGLDYNSWPQTWKTVYTKGYPRLPSVRLTREYSKKAKENLDKVLRNRKSDRAFTKKKLTLCELSTLLYYSAGVKTGISIPWDFSRRFYPSGGARYPLELYIVILNNAELEEGVYHYNVRRHSLEKLKTGLFLKSILEGLNMPWLRSASAVMFITSVFGRNQIKYGDRGYRLIFAEAGHMAQNIYLMCSALGWGCCALGGYADDFINELLDVDGVNESTVYALALGTVNKTKNK